MARTIPVLVRVDRQVKAEAEAVLAKLDLSLSDAVNLFLQQIVSEQALPFHLLPQSGVSVAAMQAIMSSREEGESDWDLEDYAAVHNARPRLEKEESLCRAVESSAARARRELMTASRRGMRPSVDYAPWWPEAD